MAGSIIISASMASASKVQHGVFLGKFLVKSTATDADLASDLTSDIQQKRDLFDQKIPELAASSAKLTRQFKELESRRKSLKPNDLAAVEKFNALAASNQADNAKAKALQIGIATAQEELNQLLADRSKLRPVASAGRSGSPQRTVMYATSRCGACIAAKLYFAQKGISYNELDLEQSSTAREEFQRLGGRGVPLILIGEKRLEGFSAQAIEALL